MRHFSALYLKIFGAVVLLLAARLILQIGWFYVSGIMIINMKFRKILVQGGCVCSRKGEKGSRKGVRKEIGKSF